MKRVATVFGRAIAIGAGVLTMGSRAMADFSYSFWFGPPPEITLVGDATYDGTMKLTTGADQAGAMWYNTKQTVATGFVTTFSFQISPGPLDIWGDGFAFVLQDSGAADSALGGGGSDLGYAGIERSIAIEFDTFTFGPPDEFPAPHVAIHSRGSNPNGADDAAAMAHTVLSDVGVDILDYRQHTGTIQYTPPDYDLGNPGLIEVYIDSTLVCSLNADLTNINGLGDDMTDNGDMYVGFTGSTGLADSTHNIVEWAFVGDTAGGCISPYWHAGGYGAGGIGSTFTDNVQFVGTRPMTFQWYKDNVEITDDDGGRIHGLGTDTIEVSSISYADQGTYVCVATNGCGSASSFEAVLHFPPTCDINGDGGVDTGDVLDLADVIASGLPAPNPDASTDFNEDGSADTGDVIDLANAIASGTCP